MTRFCVIILFLFSFNVQCDTNKMIGVSATYSNDPIFAQRYIGLEVSHFNQWGRIGHYGKIQYSENSFGAGLGVMTRLGDSPFHLYTGVSNNIYDESTSMIASYGLDIGFKYSEMNSLTYGFGYNEANNALQFSFGFSF
ncbi:hypothetical protein TUMSATVNIG3_44080 [Vibrio nigripulchritudo]|nr:hypothetical protein TUMSATVNIG3_44080 [Vibrio nigripulchritudo]